MADHGETRCPQCRSLMEDGYLPTAGGLHWYRRREASGADFAESLPGTFSWDRRARLPAWRCRKCQLVTFRYGQGVARDLENRQADQSETGAVDADAAANESPQS